MRTEVPVIKESLLNAINHAEKGGPLKNINELTKIVAEIYNSNNPSNKISPAIVLLRIKNWAIDIKTKPGKRGRQPGSKLSDEHKAAMQSGRTSRTAKFATKEDITSGFKLMHSIVPERFANIVVKLQKGSKSAALKLKCLDCSNWQPIEIKQCTCNECPLYAFRPYQGKVTTNSLVELEETLSIEDDEVAAA
jgi:ribosomal protein S27E